MRAEEERLFQTGVDLASLTEATAVVVVDGVGVEGPWGHPAWALCRGLGALGLGSVEVYGADENLAALSLLMEGVTFQPLPAEILRHGESQRGAGSEIVLHLGIDRRSRASWLEYATKRSSPFISIGWAGSRVEMTSSITESARDVASVFKVDEAPLAPISRIAAGLALQEALILAGQLDGVAPADARVSFDAATSTRSHVPGDGSWPLPRIENALIELSGAGAVGMNFLESFAPLLGRGCELRVFDFDTVGPENLAIQAAFSTEDIGRPKALVMAERLELLTEPSVVVRPVVARYEEREPGLSRPSLRVVCPDTFAARLHCNRRSLADGVPLVEAGCSPLVAQVRSYVPGRTACLEHRIRELPERAASEQDRAACSLEQALTLPGTSMICGGLLAAEALRALEPDRFGPPSRGTISYDARFGRRFGVSDSRPACEHADRRLGSGTFPKSPGVIDG